MTVIDKKTNKCVCTGACTGYATSSDCPPLIVLAVAAAAQAAVRIQ
jgi:predicted metal-binding protein